MQLTKKGRLYKSNFEELFAFLYNHANRFYGWGCSVGEYTFSLLQYDDILKENLKISFLETDGVVQLHIPDVVKGEISMTTFTFVSEDYPYFLFEGGEVIRLKNDTFYYIKSKLWELTLQGLNRTVTTVPLYFMYDSVKVEGRKEVRIN